MKERPMLYTGAMVRKVLADAKTQTRRIIKPQPDVTEERLRELGAWIDGFTLSQQVDGAWQHGFIDTECPYGQPGDRLWVRETWGVISHSWDRHGNRVKWTPNRPATAISEMPFGNGYYSGHVIYAADGPNEWSDDDDGGGEPRSLWHPSIHMPRAACRLMLEITDVRVERLQDISEADAVAEGGPVDHPNGTARGWFEQLWEKLYGAGSWDANPYVWRISFKKVEA
ncbi:hypothetical protein HA052_15940 [Chromobacterium haemolyticum]|uniref:Morphogenetic protein n=1 Tax=Chromobacterium fluminis TaxID=3044269 RepID=A0ABX0L7B8_9NEIS|nr:hypothetical protein [Chromobacterium haemolyticum]NHR06680.1 hypothetical protein [Chromobacterium haemolyticum]